MNLHFRQCRPRQRCSRQIAALFSMALGVMTAGCQATGGVVWQTGLQQPVPVVQQQDEPSVPLVSSRPMSRPAIRPGHSFDVDHLANVSDDADVRLVAASRESNAAEPVPEAAFGHQSLPGYPIPPPPMPLRDAPGSARDANSTTESDDGPTLPIGFGFLRRSLSGEDRDLTTGDGSARDVMAETSAAGPATDAEPMSPKLASPFSLRRLYEKLRPKKSQPDAPVADEKTSDSSARVCEYREFTPATSDGRAHPVSLGLPEANAGSDEPQAGQHRSAVTQACPSNFRHPLCADSTDIEKYTPQ